MIGGPNALAALQLVYVRIFERVKRWRAALRAHLPDVAGEDRVTSKELRMILCVPGVLAFSAAERYRYFRRLARHGPRWWALVVAGA